MCCCCCPPAISALFCLWCQSGCSKDTVAGALTFFPPEPALYEFQRHTKDGRLLGPNEDAATVQTTRTSGSPTNENSKKKKKQGNTDGSTDEQACENDDESNSNPSTDGDELANLNPSRPTRPMDRGDDETGQQPSEDSEADLEIVEGPRPVAEVEAEYHEQTKEQMKSPIQQLTDQALARKRRAKERAIRDATDIAAGVTYKLLLDPRLHIPPHDNGIIEAVKIPCRKAGSRSGRLAQSAGRMPSSGRNGIGAEGKSTGSSPVATIAAVVYRVPPHQVTRNTKTIIYSHGNATDIGAMFPLQVVLANSLDCNVVVYDYSGYGESGGMPDEHCTYDDIDEVYDYVMEKVAGKNGANIILYGQSVGSGPCCYLSAKASQKSNEDRQIVGGMILHSPFTSGMRVLTPSRALACLDIYPNIDRIKKVKCPVMIIHGQLDEEVDVSHGQELHMAVPQPLRREPWWVPDRGHNDITDGAGKLSEYVRRIRRFLNSLD